MEQRQIPLESIVAGDLARWQDLAGRAALPNPFFAPEFVIPAAEVFRGRPVSLVAVLDRAGEWLACMPIVTGRFLRRFPLTATASFNHHYTFLGTPLFSAESPVDALERLLAAANGHSHLNFDLVPDSGPVQEVISGLTRRKGPSPTVISRVERGALERSPDGILAPRLSKKRHKELARRQRRLEEALDGEVNCVDRSQDSAALDDFLQLEASGWKGQAGTAMACDPAHARFLKTMAKNFARLGAWRLFSLEASGQTLAMESCLVAGDTAFGFKLAYDERFAKQAPGILLHVKALSRLSDEPDIRKVDTCADSHNNAAYEMYPQRVRLQSLSIPGHGLRGRAAEGFFRAAVRLRRASA